MQWVFRGDEGFKAAARMWAMDVVRGNDGQYYMFFPAPRLWNDMQVGVAIANTPGGPFWPRPNHIRGMYGIDPSVVRLPSGAWVVFTSWGGRMYVQRTNAEFTWASPRNLIRGSSPDTRRGLTQKFATEDSSFSTPYRPPSSDTLYSRRWLTKRTTRNGDFGTQT